METLARGVVFVIASLLLIAALTYIDEEPASFLVSLAASIALGSGIFHIIISFKGDMP